MKSVNQDDTPEVSGGISLDEPLPVVSDPLPAPYPGNPCYPPAPITPVIEEPFTLIKL